MKDLPEEKIKEKKAVKEAVAEKEAAEKKEDEPQEAEDQDGHKVAGLSCKNYGGPSDEDAAEMVFWRDIPEDAAFVSPYTRNETQYLTFEPGACLFICELGFIYIFECRLHFF